MRILDRYVLQKFLLPFIYCFFGFIAIWFIFDLADNLQDFLGAKELGAGILVEYYKSQIPLIIVEALPWSILLALLYALTAMSRTNEVISMLGSGISVTRLLLPYFIVGLALVGVSAYFNYEQAPHATMIKKQMLKEIKRGKKIESGLQGYMYVNREDMRIWFIRKAFVEKNELSDIQVIKQVVVDGDEVIEQQWYAKDAFYRPETEDWELQRAKHIVLDPAGNILSTTYEDSMIVSGWKETPARIESSVRSAEHLSVPELKSYLEFNHDFPEKRLAPYRTYLDYRWSLPWACLLVVFLAAPMGIVYSRRGILGSVAMAIGLFVFYYLSAMLFVSIGEGYRISPLLAAWGPLIFFFGIGFFLLWYRSTNRDLPKIKLPWLT